MTSFFASCYDPDTDKTEAAVAVFKLPLKTGDLHDGSILSKFFVEGMLLFASNNCKALGFVKGSNEKKFTLTWRVPNISGDMWAVLDFTTGRFITNAKNNFARQGFGMAGIGAALALKSVGFRSAWVNFLTALDANDTAAVNAETMGWLSVEVGKALEQSAPNGATSSWILEHSTNDAAPEVESDLRHYFVDVDNFLALADSFDAEAQFEARFQGPQLKMLRNLLKRRKHTVLLGPPGVGKTISAFEALALEGYAEAGKDYQLFTGHDEVKSADFLGGWQPSGNPQNPYVWVNGCLVRAMTANGGEGQPILVEEFTRMPTRAQNMFISALSDGYVILNEKPSATGDGEVVRAGPQFVMIADMNVDPSADDIELYGAAFSSRVRKLEYEYPSNAGLLQILAQDVKDSTKNIRAGIAGVYDAIKKRWEAVEVNQPVSPRACVQWAEEIVALTEGRPRDDSSTVRAAALQGAELTWLRDIGGTDVKLRKTLLADVEANFRKAFSKGK